MLTNGYLTVNALQSAVGDTTYTHTAERERAIGAASRQIDLWTGRYFYQDAAPSARLFDATDRTCTYVGDFDSAAGVVVATDDNHDGTYGVVWTSGQWQPEPYVRFNGWPYTTITTTSRIREFPLSGRAPSVRVTALWGWHAIPGPIEQACETLATLYYRPNIELISADPISVAQGLCRQYAVPGGTLYVPPATPMELAPKLAPKLTRLG